MTLEDSIHSQRLRVLRAAEQLGNVSAACRQFGMSRTVFYRLRRRLELYGADGVESIIPNELLITQSVNHHTYSNTKVSVVIPSGSSTPPSPILIAAGDDVDASRSVEPQRHRHRAVEEVAVVADDQHRPLIIRDHFL